MVRALLLPALSLVATSAAAQSCFFAPSDTPTVGTCNAYPWGLASSKYQSLFTAADLGSKPGVLRELSFAPCGSGTFTASTITVRFAHYKGGTLSTNFASNLGTSPVVMMNTTSFSMPMNGNAWSPVGLTGTFVYIPAQGDLLVDIEFQGGAGGTSFHRDTRQRVYANNWSSTPPANGSSDNGALKMRVCLVGTGGTFTSYGSGCGSGPLTLMGIGTPNLNSTVMLQMSKGAATSAGAYFYGVQRLSIPLDAAGLIGCTLYTDLLGTAGTAFDAAGLATALNVPIPGNTAYLGVMLNFSGLDLDRRANALGISIANGVEMKIGQ